MLTRHWRNILENRKREVGDQLDSLSDKELVLLGGLMGLAESCTAREELNRRQIDATRELTKSSNWQGWIMIWLTVAIVAMTVIMAVPASVQIISWWNAAPSATDVIETTPRIPSIGPQPATTQPSKN